MPQQLIYTSAPRGLVPGRSGYCTVARTAAMREPLVLRLEQLSYYHHISLSGGRERPICACRIVDIRGARFHVLSRIQDAGLDFTGRTNFIAHHVVVTPTEIAQMPVPAIVLRDWSGWVKSWNQDPQMLSDEDWSALAGLAKRTSMPAVHWKHVTGDAVNGYALIEAKSGAAFSAGNLDDETVLGLLAESEELLEARDARRDFRTAAWNCTFTTSLQEQDNPGDFRWRVVHSDSPAFARLAGAPCPALASLRASRCTDDEAALARSGRKAPTFRVQPEDVKVGEGVPATLRAEADGIPTPAYQWYMVDRSETCERITGETAPMLLLRSPPVGVSRYRVIATNSAGELVSRVAVLSVEPRMRLQRDARHEVALETRNPDAPYFQPEEKIERQRNRLLSEKAEQTFYRKRKRNRIALALCFVAIAAIAATWFALQKNRRAVVTPPVEPTNVTAQTTPPTAPPPQQSNSTLSLANAATNNEAPQPAPVHELLAQSENVALPAPWKAMQVGEVARPSALGTKGSFTIIGAATGARERSDNFYFVLQPASNSLTFSARLSSLEPKSTTSNCGLMMRASTAADAPFVFVGLSSATNFLLHREAAGQTVQTGHGVSPKEDVYLTLKRDGTRFFGQASADGANWEPIGDCKEVNIPETNYLIGLAIWSGNTDDPVKARFDKVTISPTQSAP